MDEINDLFPDEAARIERRAALHSRIDQFLDGGFLPSDSGGWVEVPRDDLIAIRQIFGEIIDLKTSRDADGDRTIEFVVCNRQTSRMYTIFEEYPPEEGFADMEALLRWSEHALHSAQYANSVSETINTSVRSSTTRMLRQISEEREFLERVVALRESIPTSNFEDVAERFTKMQKETEFFTEEMIAEIQAIMATTFPDELEEIKLDVIERMAPVEHDDYPGFYREIIVPRVRGTRLFGVAFHKDPRVEEPSSRIAKNGRERKIARKKAEALAAKQ